MEACQTVQLSPEDIKQKTKRALAVAQCWRGINPKLAEEHAVFRGDPPVPEKDFKFYEGESTGMIRPGGKVTARNVGAPHHIVGRCFKFCSAGNPYCTYYWWSSEPVTGSAAPAEADAEAARLLNLARLGEARKNVEDAEKVAAMGAWGAAVIRKRAVDDENGAENPKKRATSA